MKKGGHVGKHSLRILGYLGAMSFANLGPREHQLDLRRDCQDHCRLEDHGGGGHQNILPLGGGFNQRVELGQRFGIALLISKVRSGAEGA